MPRASLRSVLLRIALSSAFAWRHSRQIAGYSTNYLIDVDNAIIVDVEATTAIRQAEILAAKRMIERSMERLALHPARLIGDTAYGSAEMLNWLVHQHGIEPHVPVSDKSKRSDGTFSREDFTYNHANDTYRCPAGKILQRYHRPFTTPRTGVTKDNLLRYRATMRDCRPCPLKPRCCPNAPTRKVLRSIHEDARDLAREIAKTDAYRTSRRQRKKVEMLFAHLKRILKLVAFDYAARAAPATSSTSPPPPRTSANWPS